MLRIILHGSSGRMGKVLRGMIAEAPDMTVAAGIDAFPDPEADFPQVAKAADCDADGDVVIDFSNHAAVPELMEFCLNRKLPVVVCTTALTEEQLRLVDEASAQIPVFRSANMSLGINALAKALKTITPVLEPSFNVEIVEKHHNKKKDSPSGTAILLADAVNSGCQTKKDYIFGRHGKDDECKITDLGIHAVRGGTIPGEHTVIYAGPDEVIELTHTALSRNIFAEGALKAAQYLAGKPAGKYSMDDLV
ncbi:MAG: 4-hydroxy-tetrahydrodipicolinate reductase [Firmicutes bacterium]|nr:4-hydroxy-tetrahydrodipicolinate reductase [Bacillota bacterium]